MQQKGATAGCVRRACLLAPSRAVGECKAQLTRNRPSQSISSFAPPAFAGLSAPTRRSDFCAGLGWSSSPPSSLPLSQADPPRPPRVRRVGCPAAAGLNTAPTSVGFWALRSLARSPGRPGLLRASLSLGAAVRQPASSPHGLAAPEAASHDPSSACGCLRLAVATNSLHRGLAPPIQCPCRAHQGRAFGAPL